MLTSIRYDTRRVNECQSALQFKWTSTLVTHSTRLNCVSVSYRVHIEVTTEGILCRRQAHAYSLEEDFLDKMVLVKWGAKQSLYISIPPAILRLLPFFPLIEMCQGRYLVKSIFVGQSYYATRDSNPQPPDSKSDTLSIAPAAQQMMCALDLHTHTPHQHIQ